MSKGPPAKPQGQQQLQVATVQFTGPLPAPQLLAEYDRVVPGLAERVVGMAERQAAHRQKLEAFVVRQEAWRSWGGLVAAFIVALAALVASAWAVHAGQAVTAAVIATVDLAAVVGVFVYGRHVVKEAADKATK